jgi:excisionase family DNA binding protein
MPTLINVSSLLTYTDAANALNCTEVNVRRLVSQGKIGHIKIGHRVRFKPEHLAAFVKEIPAVNSCTSAKRSRTK